MRFMMLVKADAQSEAGVLPDETLLAKMGAYNESLVKAGVLLAGEGLKPTADGARVRYADGKVTVTKGPLKGSQLVAGYWLIKTKSRDEAVEWAKRAPFKEGQVEIRQIFELEDFPVDASEQPDGWRDKEKAFREETPSGQKEAPVSARKAGKRRYISFVMADRATEAGVMPSPDGLEKMGQLMAEAVQRGIMLGGEGLHPSSKGARVHYDGSKRTVVDGPFAEAKELVAGYALMLFGSKEEAIEEARRFVAVDAPLRENNVSEVELRELFELEDFPASDARDTHARLQAEIGSR